MRAPVVLAKGADQTAARIREIATENKVTLFESPLLARALYWTTDLGQEIPSQLYLAVAQVLTYVYRLKVVREHGGPWPDRPTVEVDEKLASGPQRRAGVDRNLNDGTQGTNLLGSMRSTAMLAAGLPMVVLAMLAMIVLPMPPLVLDALFTFNICISLVVILAVVYVMRPLDLAAFPTVLLLATLLRLALNVASTRVVLLHGHTGTDAAGKVIEAFGEFVVGGNYAVGIVVFAILVIVNFVVVTKGAGRVSEVSARFTLDSMPGKQMAIDADLNAGIITQQEAVARRHEVRMEADFYGSMDGASKFVRGDAVAGLLILFINLIGGMLIGVLQHDMDVSARRRRPTPC